MRTVCLREGLFSQENSLPRHRAVIGFRIECDTDQDVFKLPSAIMLLLAYLRCSSRSLFIITIIYVALTTIHANPVQEDNSISDQSKEEITLYEIQIIEIGQNGRTSRNARTGEAELWPKGVVPFRIDPSLRKERKYILQAMNNYHQNSCVRFVRHTDEEDYINIMDAKRGCSSRVGRIGGEQIVSLSGEYCFYTGTIVHELGHVLGFEHEHQRGDRDDYVVIDKQHLTTKVRQDDMHNFDPKPSAVLLTDYNYNSIMHYGPHWMRPKKDGVKLVDPKFKFGLDLMDIEAVNKLYNCSKRMKKSTRDSS